MCGIVGLWNYKRKTPVNRELLERMTGTLAHRGPDDSGAYLDDAAGLALGYRRLAIIDLSPAGHQPMSNEDGSVWLVFNGEIYNFHELRPDLEARGHAFRSRTDSEVILHLYEERGVDVHARPERHVRLRHLGCARSRSLLLARDRAGQEAAVLPATTASGCCSPASSRRYSPTPAWRREVEPGGPGRIYGPGLRGRAAHDLRGHSQAAAGAHAGVRGGPDISRALLGLAAGLAPAERPARGRAGARERAGCLDEAVRIGMMSDVPLGAFLSGGVDSSAVVAG